MTAFTKDNINDDGMYLMYKTGVDRTNWRFIARFKYARDGKGSFKTFLIKNFTVEEYFAAIEAGGSPLSVLMERGYLLPHMKRWCKEHGYPATKEGYERYQKEVWQPAMDASLAKYKAQQKEAANG